LLASRNDKGELVKRSYGSMMLWGFRVLRHLKFLRGTALDLFGRTEERRTERALIQEYKSAIDTVLAGLKADNHAQALEMARIPEKIKGYGHVKERNLRAVRQQWSDLMARWQA
jgi:indolepyruvate ferredoxin oxidoreductase